MFFIASKIIFFCIQPSSLAFLALAGGVLFLQFKRPKPGAFLLSLGFGIIVLFGILPGGNILILPLEQRFQPRVMDVPQEKISGIILLGGFEDGALTDSRGGLALNEAAERLIETVRLAHALPDAKVIFTGGSGSLFGGEGIGSVIAKYIIDTGIEPSRIVVENNSRNTYENAMFTKALVNPQPSDKWLLVTSAFHMPRSVGVFRKAGFDVVPYPVDFRTRGRSDAVRPFDSISAGLTLTDLAAKEWIGLLAYWASGRSASLFPGP
ncbi:YdcF family protein [Hyphomicrobium facile]|uniref:Uncharacterized SAM-binding protein YcdF, DUF218 family n=1 Tax=Hyphomicrobium facile TaxID=51670 RepID=A0A1I7N000_9HYPH|nr:YdcF family protein [Hyphomicrobium facile]SFV27925.1 Uncharacterized SAM-binding protein YcdF, DUF218 family [Hyphomicrobium facile]